MYCQILVTLCDTFNVLMRICMIWCWWWWVCRRQWGWQTASTLLTCLGLTFHWIDILTFSPNDDLPDVVYGHIVHENDEDNDYLHDVDDIQLSFLKKAAPQFLTIRYHNEYIIFIFGNHCCYQLCWAKLLKQVVIRKLLNYWRSPLKCIVLEATYLLYGRHHSPSSFCISNICSYFCAYFLWVKMRECLDNLIIGILCIICNSAADFVHQQWFRVYIKYFQQFCVSAFYFWSLGAKLLKWIWQKVNRSIFIFSNWISMGLIK